MKKIPLALTVCLMFTFSTITFAYNPTINEIQLPFEVKTMDSDIETKAEYLGELTGYPQMYEFVVGEEVNLDLVLNQLPKEDLTKFSLIVVRENLNNGGVSEIGRLQSKDITWTRTKDRVLGMTLEKSQTFSAELTPGIYRVEVSTPDNYGSYLLEVGTKPYNPGYFATLADVRTIQNFFGLSLFSMLRSSYVIYPLGIIILLSLFFVTRRYQTELKARFGVNK